MIGGKSSPMQPFIGTVAVGCGAFDIINDNSAYWAARKCDEQGWEFRSESLDGAAGHLSESGEALMAPALKRGFTTIARDGGRMTVGNDLPSSELREIVLQSVTFDTTVILRIKCTEDGHAFLRMDGHGEGDFKWFKDTYSSLLRPRSSEREVHVLVRGPGGLYISSLGKHGLPLERGNYDPSVLVDFDHVVEDLGRKTPCGRLSLFEGPPGTGKTHLIRGIIDSPIEATFIIVPPNVAGALMGPDMISPMLDIRSETHPTVLILEDADEALASRKFDNISSVNSLLAFGDGILGSALDVRIIATTNQKKVDLDEALIRPGRLCRHVHVGQLSLDTANSILDRIDPMGKTKRYDDLHVGNRKLSLADVYRAARTET